MSDPIDVTVVDVPEESRYVARLDGYEAELVYVRRGNRMYLVHTGVPDELEGRGVGSALARHALAAAGDAGDVVVPRCPFVRSWLERHPDVAEQLTIDWD